MKDLTGNIYDGDELLAKGVKISLNEAEPSAGYSDWSGDFAHSEHPLSGINHKLRLVLSDGRSGNIRIQSVQEIRDNIDLFNFSFLGIGYLSKRVE